MKKVLIISSWDFEPISWSKYPKEHLNLKYLKKLTSDEIREKYGLKHTWFIELDLFTDAFSEDCLKIFNHPFFKEAEKQGDEIGLHFHPINIFNEKFYQTREVENIIPHLENKLGELKKKLFSVRTGWNYGSNELIKFYEKMGFKVDGSCCPGKYNLGTKSIYNWEGKRNFYDWRGSPFHPYHPLKSDYLKQGKMKILEMPVYTLPYKEKFISFQLHDLPKLMKYFIESAFITSKKKDCLVILQAYSHNFDIDYKRYKNFIKNLDVIKEISKKHNVDYEFVTINKARKIWEKHGKSYTPLFPKSIQINKLDKIKRITFKNLKESLVRKIK